MLSNLQARKAMHVLYKRIRNLNIPVDLQLHLFDHVILPIAYYDCEIWGFENSKIIENLHNEFLRYIVNLRKITPIYMLHAEMGRHPIQINIKSRMIGFWLSIVNGKGSKSSKLLYTIMLKEQENVFYDFKCIRCIYDILVSVGRPDLFKNYSISNPKAVKLKYFTIIIRFVYSRMERKGKDLFKRKTIYIKDKLNFEKYFITVSKFYYDKIINIEQEIIGSQLRLEGGMIRH